MVFSIFWQGQWFLSFVMILIFPLRWLTGDQILLVRLTNYLMPWLLVLLVPGIILAFFEHRKLLGFSLALPTLFIIFSYAPLFLPRTKNFISKEVTFKVMSYNIWSKNKNIKKAAEIIKREKPDILLLQELDLNQIKKILSELNNMYIDTKPYVVYESEILQAVVSRYPINQATMQKKGKIQRVVIDTQHGSIVVFNVHPLRGNWLRRHNQMLSLLTQDIVHLDCPVILGGDFNTTDQSQTFRLIKQYLNNAHLDAGSGMGFTFPSASSRFLNSWIPIPPLVRIDHVFFSDHFSAQKATTLSDSGGSDHLPIIAELSLTTPLITQCRQAPVLE